MQVGEPLDGIGEGLLVDLRVLLLDAVADDAVGDSGKIEIRAWNSKDDAGIEADEAAALRIPIVKNLRFHDAAFNSCVAHIGLKNPIWVKLTQLMTRCSRKFPLASNHPMPSRRFGSATSWIAAGRFSDCVGSRQA